jgi:hypothetical protein
VIFSISVEENTLRIEQKDRHGWIDIDVLSRKTQKDKSQFEKTFSHAGDAKVAEKNQYGITMRHGNNTKKADGLGDEQYIYSRYQ